MIRRDEPETVTESDYKAERITLALKYIHGLFLFKRNMLQDLNAYVVQAIH